MSLLQHKRFLYKYAGSKCFRIGVTSREDLRITCRKALGDMAGQYTSEENAFEATFLGGSVFERWIDDYWQDTEVP